MSRTTNGPVFGLQVAEDIVPIADLKAHLSKKIRDLRACRRPIVITQNGKAAAVLLAPEEFDRLNSQAQFIAAVREGLADSDSGRVISDAELGRSLDARFGSLQRSK
jgi:prevent-host-death family protein